MAPMLRAIGLMSGTSMDGIDVAMIETDGETRLHRGPGLAVGFDPAFRRRLSQSVAAAATMTDRLSRPGDLFDVEATLTDLHARAVETFCRRHAIDMSSIDVVGFHGQTVLHRPSRHLTVQLGDGARLAEATGMDVVADMRGNDMIHGGQGAPLVPVYHRALAANLPADLAAHRPLAFVNIGGISNATFIDRDGAVTAFDCGPGNALIDQWIEEKAGKAFDENGTIAASGTVDSRILADYLADPFFTRRGARSLDRGDFTIGRVRDLPLADGAATLSRLTAEAVIRSAAEMPEQPKLWIVCGGGARNAAILSAMRELAPDSWIAAAEEAGLSSEFMEAEAWAYLAARSLRALPLTYPSTTGVGAPMTGGVLHPAPQRRLAAPA